jgi:parallel beta-helix repeat protein
MSTIGAAVSAAAAGDTITVGAGTYNESVTITKPLMLQGVGTGAIINAAGNDIGIKISGTSNVTIANLTIVNAGGPGIWVTGSSNVTITGNNVIHNTQALTETSTGPSCPAGPAGDQDDCGGALFLDNLTNSTISGNTVERNADGLTLTDESGPSSGNTITNNTFMFNGPECGLVLASHNGKAPNGVFNNTVSNNISSGNGASGIGVFSPFPGTAAYNNVVTGNTLTNNAHAGVTLHTHAPGTNDNNNQITNNIISNDNTAGDDSAGVFVTAGIILAAPPIANPITGTTITGNTISAVGIGIYLGNTTGSTISDNTNTATTPVLTVGPGTTTSGTPPAVSSATFGWPTSGGLTTAFAVSFSSATPGQGEVLFGTSCNSLIGTATEDAFAGTTQHWVLVTRDDFNPYGVGLTPGTTYYYAVETVSPSGTTVDDNGGKCYSVTLPSTVTTMTVPAAPDEGSGA